MRNAILKLCVAAAFVAIALVPARAADDTMPAVGKKAPTFTLPSQTGQEISLKSFHGHWVVLYFYPKDMTTGCTIEAHNFQRDLKKFEADNAVILGVSVDTMESHQQFCAKDGLTFHLLADPDHKVVDEYGSLGHFKMPNSGQEVFMAERHTFLINPKGKIVKVWTKVNPQVHSEEVLAAINELKK